MTKKKKNNKETNELRTSFQREELSELVPELPLYTGATPLYVPISKYFNKVRNTKVDPHLCGRFFRAKKDLLVYKKVTTRSEGVVAHLVIPKGTVVYLRKISYINGIACFYVSDKIRAERAFVYRMTKKKKCFSMYDSTFKYKEGTYAIPLHFSTEPETCAGGIHFFSSYKFAKEFWL